MKKEMKVTKPIIPVYALMFTCVTLFMTLDIHLPSLPQIAKDLNTTPFMAQLIFIVSYCQLIFMPLIWGTLCDFIGRRTVVITALLIGISGQILCAFAPSIEYLICFRFIQYLGSGAIGSVTIAVICDLLKDTERARTLALFEMSTPFAIIIAPIIGAFTCEYIGWRGNFMLLAILQIISFVFVFISVPETLHEKKPLDFKEVYNNFSNIIVNKKFMSIIFLLGFLEAGWLVFVAHSSFIYIDKFHFTPHEFSFYQVIPVVVFFSGLSLYRVIVNKIGITQLLNFGIIGYSIFGVGMLLLMTEVIPVNPQTIMMLLCIGNLTSALISPGGNTKAMDLINEKMIGTASSLLNVVIGLVPGISMLISSVYFDETFIPVFGGILATVIMVLLIWVSLRFFKQKNVEVAT